MAALLVGCSDGGSPTEPASPDLVLTGAAVKVDGQTLNGGTFVHQHAAGDPGSGTRFEATLHFQGQPATGETVRVAYQTPGGMMGSRGTFVLYDDGTRGDPHPGDGVYCFEDFDGHYGFHHAGARHGQYHYDFYGLHHAGYESNHMQITVALAD